jgi:hypothetical protein
MGAFCTGEEEKKGEMFKERWERDIYIYTYIWPLSENLEFLYFNVLGTHIPDSTYMYDNVCVITTYMIHAYYVHTMSLLFSTSLHIPDFFSMLLVKTERGALAPQYQSFTNCFFT